MGELLNAGDICNRIVTIAGRDLNVVQAAQLMREHHVGCLVVTELSGDGRRVVGMLTDRDIVTAVVAKELAPRSLRIEDVMSTEVVIAQEQSSLAGMLDTMRRHGLRRLPITSASGLLIGLVTLDDLLKIMAEQLHSVVQVIETEQTREHRTRP